MTYIVVVQQVWTVFHIIIQVKRSTGLKLDSKGRHGWRLGEIFHGPYASKLLVRVVGGGEVSWPSGSVAMLRGVRGCRWLMMMLLLLIIVVIGHDCER